MFGLFKRSRQPLEILEQVLPHWNDVIVLVTSIDGPFINIYEAANFVASIATIKVRTFQKVDPSILAESFHAEWVDRVVATYSVDGKPVSKAVVDSRLRASFPIYREMFLKTIDPSCSDKAHDNAVQLMWEVFTNCTGKKKPEGDGSFLKLVVASGELVGIACRVMNDVHE